MEIVVFVVIIFIIMSALSKNPDTNMQNITPC